MHERRKSFKTLDDRPSPYDNLPANVARPAGYWEIQSEVRPNLWRRFWVRALLGWRWKPIK